MRLGPGGSRVSAPPICSAANHKNTPIASITLWRFNCTSAASGPRDRARPGARAPPSVARTRRHNVAWTRAPGPARSRAGARNKTSRVQATLCGSLRHAAHRHGALACDGPVVAAGPARGGANPPSFPVDREADGVGAGGLRF